MRWATDQTGGTTTTRRREVVHRRSALWTPLGGRENEDSGGETEDVVGSGLSETDDDDEASNPSPVTLATTASKRALYCGVAEGGDARGSGATPSFPSATQTATGSGSVPTKTSSSSASSSRKQPSRSAPTPVSAAYLLIGAWANGVVRKGVRRLSRAPVSSSSSSSTAIVSDSSTESSSLDSDSDQPHALSKSHHSTLQRVTHQACKSQRGLPRRTTSISHMPTEILFKIFRHVPTSNLASMLLATPYIAAVASDILSERTHFITSLEDLRSLTHDIPFHLLQQPSYSSLYSTSLASWKSDISSEQHLIPCKAFELDFSHQLKRKQIGPTFYRSGTMILFARHFTRLIPEARALLGVGYALVLAWFMCLFYFLPFLGALTLYFLMDVVDLTARFLRLFIHSLPLTLLSLCLPKTHLLHPNQPAQNPRVPALLIRRLQFSGAASPIVTSQNEPSRCCGLGGTSWDHPYHLSMYPTDSTLSGTHPIPTLTPAPATAAFWGLMSPYTPWHLYLLTWSLRAHSRIEHLTLVRVSLAWWFRLHPAPALRVLVLHACEVDETGIGLVAKAFRGLRGLVLRGSEVRCGGWDMESIRRASLADVEVRSKDLVEAANVAGGELEVTKGWWRKGTQSKVPPGLSVSEGLRVVRFEMCLGACAVDAVRMVLDRCPSVERVEFVGCGGEEELFLEGVAGGIVELERVDKGAVAENGIIPEGVEVAREPLWWKGQTGFDDKIDACIQVTRIHLQAELNKALTGSERLEGSSDEDMKVDGKEFLPVAVPTGFRKTIVLQGSSLQGFRDKWYAFVQSRQRGQWVHA